MKKLWTKVCALAVLTAMFLCMTAAAAGIGTGTVTGNSLRMRSAASTSSSVMTYLNKGNKVDVLEQLDGWYKVEYNGRTGYLSSDYVNFTPAEEAGVARTREVSSKVGVISGSSVNFRSQPSTGASVITTLAENTEVELLEVADGWCKAVYDGKEGYVSADYVTVDGLPLVNPRGIVTGNAVNVRSGPSTGYGVVSKVYAGTIVDLTSVKDGWYGVSYNGVKGYISGDYVRVYREGEASGTGQSIVNKAKQYLGVPYVYGGASPRGFDCSGFTMYVYSQFGYSLPHSASSQWASAGTSVDRANLQPGDLVFFNDPSISRGKACSHTGIYVGNGQFIHASSGSHRGVVISNLSDSYYSRYYKRSESVV